MIEQFWSQVEKTDHCWLWKGPKFRRGYGRFEFPDGRNISAHRLAYQELIGPIPSGLTLDHVVCENPSCVNPSHLKVATRRENILRGNCIGAKNARKLQCFRGHPFTAESTHVYTRPNGDVERICRVCRRKPRQV